MSDIILVPALQVLLMAISFYKLIIFVRVIISWLVSFNIINHVNQFVAAIINAVISLTEPVLSIIRNKLPRTAIDISPIILLFTLLFLERVIANIIYKLI